MYKYRRYSEISNNRCISKGFLGVSAGKILVLLCTQRFTNYKLDNLRLWGLPFTNDRPKSPVQVCRLPHLEDNMMLKASVISMEMAQIIYLMKQNADF